MKRERKSGGNEVVYISRERIPDSQDFSRIVLIFFLGHRAAISTSYPPSSVVAPGPNFIEPRAK